MKTVPHPLVRGNSSKMELPGNLFLAFLLSSPCS